MIQRHPHHLPTYKNEGTLWGAIHEAGMSVFETLENTHHKILQKDAMLEVPKVFSEVSMQAAKIFEESFTHSKVMPNENLSGSIDCVFLPDDTHADIDHSGKTYSKYVSEKYQEIVQEKLAKIKNPISKKILASQLQEHGKNVVSKATKQEIGMLRQAKEQTLQETAQNLANSCYSDPSLYSQNRELALSSLNGANLPEHIKKAYESKIKQDLSISVCKSLLRTAPDSVKQECLTPKSFAKDLDASMRDKFLNQADNLIVHSQHKKETSLKKLIPNHFESIFQTGKGINEVSKAIKDDEYLAAEESAYKEAYNTKKQLDKLPINMWGGEIAKLAPTGGEKNYNTKAKVHQIISRYGQSLLQMAEDDPAQLIEHMHADELSLTTSNSDRVLMVKHLQEKKGIKNPKLLTNSQIEGYAKAINDIAKAEHPNLQELESAIKGLLASTDQSDLSLQITDEVLSSDQLSPMIKAYAYNFVRSNNVSEDIGQAFLMQKRLFAEVSKADQKKFGAEIESNEDFKKYSLGMHHLQPHLFDREVQVQKETIKNLARYYQMSEGASTSKAIEKACTNILSNYITPLANFTCEKRIIDDGKIIELNEKDLNKALCYLRPALIQEKLEYSSDSSFGKSDIQPDKAKKVKQDALANGFFVLTKDKKHVNYLFPMQDTYRPLMKNGHERLEISLKALNDFEQIQDTNSSLHKILQDSKKQIEIQRRQDMENAIYIN